MTATSGAFASDLGGSLRGESTCTGDRPPSSRGQLYQFAGAGDMPLKTNFWIRLQHSPAVKLSFTSVV